MAAELAGGLGAVGLFALPGYGLTEFVPRLRRLPVARRAAYGYLLGVAVVAGTLYTLSHVAGVPLRPPAIWTAAAVPVAAGLVARLARHRRGLGGRPGREQPQGAAPPAEIDQPQARQLAGSQRNGAAVQLREDTAAYSNESTGKPMYQGPTAQGPTVRSHEGALSWLREIGGPFGAVCLLLAAVVCAAVFAEAVSDPVNDWDGRMTWGAQARYVRQAGTVDAEALRNPRWYITHPQYPLLLPVAQVAVLEAFGADPDAPRVRAVYAAFLPALLLLIYDGARRGAGPRAAALAVLALAVTPYMLLGTGGAATTYSDLALACFYGAALGMLLAPRPRTMDGLAAGLLLGAAVLVKNEGAVLALLALALGWRPGRPEHSDRSGDREPSERPERFEGVEGAKRGALSGGAAPGSGARSHGVSDQAATSVPPRMRRLLAAAAPVVLALALLGSWRAGIPNRQDDAYPELLQVGRGSLAAMASGVAAHLTVCAPVVWHAMTSTEHWAGFWWMVAAALVAGHRALRHPLNRRRLAAAAGPPALAWAAYAVHPLPALIAAVTWERFLLQAAVPLLIVVAAAFAAMGRRWQGAARRIRPAGDGMPRS